VILVVELIPQLTVDLGPVGDAVRSDRVLYCPFGSRLKVGPARRGTVTVGMSLTSGRRVGSQSSGEGDSRRANERGGRQVDSLANDRGCHVDVESGCGRTPTRIRSLLAN
jgi:hypothetical protein